MGVWDARISITIPAAAVAPLAEFARSRPEWAWAYHEHEAELKRGAEECVVRFIVCGEGIYSADADYSVDVTTGDIRIHTSAYGYPYAGGRWLTKQIREIYAKYGATGTIDWTSEGQPFINRARFINGKVIRSEGYPAEG